MSNRHLNTGINLASSGQLRAGIAWYDSAIASDSTNYDALNYKGYALLRMGRTEEALQLMVQGVDGDSINPWSYYNLALAYWANRDTTNRLIMTRVLRSIRVSWPRLYRWSYKYSTTTRSTTFAKVGFAVAAPCELDGWVRS